MVLEQGDGSVTWTDPRFLQARFELTEAVTSADLVDAVTALEKVGLSAGFEIPHDGSGPFLSIYDLNPDHHAEERAVKDAATRKADEARARRTELDEAGEPYR
jgi:hypothetical protein